MPEVREGESERDYVKRCVPVLIAEGKPQDQSLAVCYALYDEHKNKKSLTADQQELQNANLLVMKSFDVAQYKAKSVEEITQEMAIKHHVDAKDIVLKGYGAELESPLGSHEVVCKITTDKSDRIGDAVVPEGCDPSDFLKTGTVFLNHNHAMPVAHALTLSKSANGWVSKAEFSKRPDYIQGDYYPDVVRALVQTECLKGVSIGLVPTEMRPPTKQDRERYGADVKRVISKWKLLEYSFAPLACNPDALVMAVGKNLVPEMVAKAMDPQFDASKVEKRVPMCPTCGEKLVDGKCMKCEKSADVGSEIEVVIIDNSPKHLTMDEVKSMAQKHIRDALLKSQGRFN